MRRIVLAALVSTALSVFAFGQSTPASVAGLKGAVPTPKVALEGGRIIPIRGDEIAEGTVLIENGRITAVGESVEIPYDAMVVDVSGKVVMPGMIDAHSWRGLDVPNENLPVTPYLDASDALDPSRLYFEDALRDGLTSVHVIVANDCVIGGVSRVVHPIGLTPDEMTLQRDVSLKMSIAPKRGSDRMAQMATFRETFRELAEHLEILAEKKYEDSLKKKDEKIDVGPEEARKRGKELIEWDDYDDAHRNLVRLTRGELGAFIYVELAGDVARAVKLARDNGFFDKTTFVVGPDCYKAVKDLKEADRPVVIEPPYLHRERDPITGKIKEIFVPKVFADARVPFSLLPDPSSSLAERYANYQAARCVRSGVSRQRALDAITINPARALGIADRVGTLEPDKIANIVVLSGDPLDFSSWVEHVYIKGIQAYDRKEDVRLQRLLGDEPSEVAEVKPAPKAEEPSDKESAEKDSAQPTATPSTENDAPKGDEPEPKAP